MEVEEDWAMAQHSSRRHGPYRVDYSSDKVCERVRSSRLYERALVEAACDGCCAGKVEV
jgi:hypothetical protein